VRKPVGARSSHVVSKRRCAILAAALLALAPFCGPASAQTDLATLRARAAQGEPEAQNALANAYVSDPGTQNLAEAFRLYQQAADKGLAAAQFNLGMMYELGRGAGVDAAAAFKHYLRAAEQGFAPAQFNVGNMYANGTGVKQDYFEASLWFRQAADRGIPEAQYNLALAHELGRGVPKDESAAQRWYRAAAAKQYARAQYNLALMLEEGRGSRPDPLAAIESYRAAAAQNFAPAQNNLGILLAEGRGAEPNLVEAYTWLALAVENGAAPVGRDLVRQQLSPEQFEQANAAIAALRPKLGLASPSPRAPATSPVATAEATRSSTPATSVVTSAAPPAATQAAGSTSAAVVSAAPRPASAPLAGSPSAEIIALNTRVVAAESEAERLRTERARLTEASEVLRQEKAALEQRLTAAATTVTPARNGEAERHQFQTELAEARRTTLRLSAENERLKAAALALGDGRSEPLAAENARLTSELSALQQQLERLRSQSTDYEASVARLEAANRALSARPDPDAVAAKTNREAFERLHAEHETATRAVAELKAQNESLQQDLVVAKQSASAALAAHAAAVRAGPTDALRLEMQTLQDQVRGLEAQLDDDRKYSARELAAVAAQLQNARETNRSLTEANRSLLQARGIEDSSVQSQLTQLSNQLKAAQAELERARAEQVQLAATLESRTRELAAVRSTANQADQKQETLRAQVDEISQRLAAAERRMTEARLDAETARAEASQAAADLTSLGAKLADANRQAAAVAELAAVNESLTATNAQLGARVRDFTDQLTAARAEQARLVKAGDSSQLRSELSETKARLNEAQQSAQQQGAVVSEIAAANEKLSAEVNALQGQLASVRTENARLAQGDAARQAAEQRAASLSNAAAQLTATQRDLAASREEIVRLTTTVQAIDRDRGARITQLQQENVAIAARLRQAQGTLDQIASAARLVNPSAGTAVSPIPAAALPLPAPSAATVPSTTPLPASTPIVPAARVHVVVEGDSLTRISVRYYGTTNRWQEIYEANRETLRGENTLRPGQRLRIP
jgi:TPR repeat protein/LysM repeat protein